MKNTSGNNEREKTVKGKVGGGKNVMLGCPAELA